ncbi:unnamed protein product [Orchesella dallaii]|uniref:Uncharacterized protein n=1 Tax=Orchesella dallaii TaxID=48710 RepID=A0ABP1QTA3_9HEXA
MHYFKCTYFLNRNSLHTERKFDLLSPLWFDLYAIELTIKGVPTATAILSCILDSIKRKMDKHHYWKTPELQNRLQDRSHRRMMTTHSKIKAITETSAILAGFGMMSLVEFQLKPDAGAPKELVIAFVASTCWLISVQMIALFIASFLLPNIEKSNNNLSFMEEGEGGSEDLIDKLQWYFR